MPDVFRERLERGRALRAEVPRTAHATWEPAADRVDPIAALEASNADRLKVLVPVRYGRMLGSPFAFLRGSAAIMAMDLARTPVTGIRVQACGDAHVSNFGEFATPERSLVFDINDFDETLPGPWEWDLKRLAASLDVVVRLTTREPGPRAQVIAAAVRSYRERMAEYVEFRALDLWYDRIALEDVLAHFPSRYRPRVRRHLERAGRRTHLAAAAKLTRAARGRRQFIEDPPLIVRLENIEHDPEEAIALFEGYRSSLPYDRLHVLDRFRLMDIARKTVGVGSVGTRCWVALFEGPAHPSGDPLILQIKEAGPSVLEPYAGPSGLPNHGLRVVTGQRLTQGVSDMFLGWSEGPRSGRHYYVRQLWDMKTQGDPATMELTGLAHYGALCARALARAHARTGDAAAIAGYLGRSDRFDRAMAGFASAYGDQVELDHAALVEAVRTGRVEAVEGV